MPFRRRKPRRAPRRRLRRKTRGTRKLRIGKTMRPAIYRFKRSFQHTFALNTPVPEGWTADGNGFYRQFIFYLSQVTDHTDFTNLFTEYKITGAAIKMYFSSTNSGVSGTVFDNTQILMRTIPWSSGRTQVVTDDLLLSSQTTKRKLCLNTNGRPVNVFMRLNQLGEVYHSVANSDYVMAKPRFISTDEVSTPHYGVNMRLDRVDGQAFTSGLTSDQYVRLETILYIQCKQVH